jgi:hypothetical protein
MNNKMLSFLLLFMLVFISCNKTINIQANKLVIYVSSDTLINNTITQSNMKILKEYYSTDSISIILKQLNNSFFLRSVGFTKSPFPKLIIEINDSLQVSFESNLYEYKYNRKIYKLKKELFIP